MGWILLQNGTRQSLGLRAGTVQVGRAQTAQIRPTHQSVSRLHAEITVESYAGPLTEVTRPVITVIDRSSTGHTFVNGKPPAARGQPNVLTDGDLLSFGVDPVTFTVRWSPLVISYSSRAGPEESRRIEELARASGAFLTSDWHKDCTHLMMDQLAITPKLLCCAIAGGVPVAPTFLDALAQCAPASPLVDPLQHQPKPPGGADAKFAAELQACCTAPRSRRDLLVGVCVVFGARQAFDVLSKALQHAGSQVHLLATTPDETSQAAQELLRCHNAPEGPPREIWAVPALPEGSVRSLMAPLQGLGVRALAVPLHTVVAGLLSGSLNAVHAEASALFGPGGGSLCDEATGHSSGDKDPDLKTETPRPAGTINGVAPAIATDVAKAVKNEESLGHSQAHQTRLQPQANAVPQPQQPQQPESQQPQQPQQQPQHQQHLQPASIDRAISTDQRAPAAKRRRLPAQFGTDDKSDLFKKPKVEDAEALACDLPSSAAAALAGAPPATIASSRGGGGASQRSSVPYSQPKLEPKEYPKPEACGGTVNSTPFSISQAQCAAKPEAKLKLEACEAGGVPAVVESSLAKMEAEGQEKAESEEASMAPLERVQHPIGTWLPSLATLTSARRRDFATVDGVDVPRATWRPGGAEVVMAAQPVSVLRRPVASRRNFKLFQKAYGQRALPKEAVVPVAPWAPTAGPPLAEVFCSQPLDSQSQLPPVGM